MYKKKNRKPLMIAMMIALVCIGAAIGVPKMIQNRGKEPERETEAEAEKHEVLIYKTNAGSIEFDKAWLKEDKDTETVLQIEENTLVSLNVTPVQNKILESVDIVDHNFEAITSMQREASEDSVRVTFTMPDKDIILNFNFADENGEEEVTEKENGTEAETTPEPSTPYGLTLHGVTADIITAYNGQFDDTRFLQQLGDTLHIDSARSEYSDVTDVTFSTEEYTGEKSTDQVVYYVFFNHDPKRKMVSTYYRKDDAYVFTEVAEEESEETPSVQETPAAQTSVGSVQGGSSASSSSATTGNGYTGGTSIPAGSGETVSTSFDILQVSTTFLAYTGDKDIFYDKTFQYVLQKGLTGNIVGTMSEYEIDSEAKKATFKIVLNIGNTITGTYNKSDNSYHFNGL